MIDLRMTGLVCAPALLVGGLYELTMRGERPAFPRMTASALADPAATAAAGPTAASPVDDHGTHATESRLITLRDGIMFDMSAGVSPDDPLTLLCLRAAAELKPQLDQNAPVLIHPPFVLGGDQPADALQRILRDVVLTVHHSLATMYFDEPPSTPITVVLLQDDASFQRHAVQLDHARRLRDYGYYHRGERRVVVNLGTGEGTLAHELTHALGHADFPEMPPWLDEGLASLNEESELTEDGLRLVGLPNWRQRQALAAHRQGELKSLQTLIARPRLDSGDRLTEYAHLRSFCLYLQQRNLLGSVYRKCRAVRKTDPAGWSAVCTVLQDPGLKRTEGDFLRWLADSVETDGSGPLETLERPAGSPASPSGQQDAFSQPGTFPPALPGSHLAQPAASPADPASTVDWDRAMEEAAGVMFDSARPPGEENPSISPVPPPIETRQPAYGTPPVSSPGSSPGRPPGGSFQPVAPPPRGAAAVDFIQLD
ncbi:MAG: hypothetical protein KDA79_07810 [Planctomycetaceae bacterium]|nr:hypothetical protein [Planctomycetaceae bacterium]